MKAIVCEMCNSNDIVKQDGLYVCQNCGTKYTAEDAKKLMVDISGSSIIVDESEKAKRYRKLARESRSMGNIEKAGEYYNQLVTIYPDDWEAVFFSVYCSSANCALANLSIAASNVGEVAKLAASKAKNCADGSNDAYDQITNYVLKLEEAFYESSFAHLKKFSQLDTSLNEYLVRIQAIFNMIWDTAEAMLAYGQNANAIKILKRAFDYGSIHQKYNCVKSYQQIANIINVFAPGEGSKLMDQLTERANQELAEKEAKLAEKKARVKSMVRIFAIGLVSLIAAYFLDGRFFHDYCPALLGWLFAAAYIKKSRFVYGIAALALAATFFSWFIYCFGWLIVLLFIADLLALLWLVFSKPQVTGQ